MSDLHWDEVKSFFDPDLMGTLPDVIVPNASAEDWQTVFDLVKARGWQWEFRQADTTPPLPSAAEALARLEDGEVGELHVFPVPEMLVIFRLMSAEEIDFDVDLRELQGQAGVDKLCGFLAEIGRKLGKPVLMLPEGGSQAHANLGFDPTVDRVVLLADPRR
ncbi:hypothetical protein [Amycolatopsis azurea]|uniref:Uncharacterized protein n=1 Tax=Amycolatopsis azurea DSM 43854 TaxID=1238180 RepID=M2Q865_9PSEU|nr:hypothetical protein [Amycolatopsis azurea]EMD22292.1 hypothetical protein C791_8609 [Amycolatopsis azurea DSM 43854]OOC06045.1 hypothetical protein B0293_14410 [Amycolatopsis azurea DSM 43854]